MDPWFELDVVVAEEDEEAAAAAIVEAGSAGLCIESHADGPRILAYFTIPPPRSLVASLDRNFALTAHRTRTRRMGDDETDWSENWKDHFRPMIVGERLYICPPWDSEPPPDRLAIVINPGQAFGTGQHATTRGCLLLIESYLRQHPGARCADIGTGSGILAIAMARLGAGLVSAVDNDPVAVRTANENLARNADTGRIRLGARLEDICGPCDLISANLFADLLIALAPEITQLATSRAVLVASGMLASDEERVVEGLGHHGWTSTGAYREAPWSTLRFERAQP